METLHLFFTTGLPESDPDDDDDAPELLLIDTELESGGEDEVIPVDALEFVTTLVSNLDDPSLLPAAVDRWWQELTGESARIELLASDARLLAPHELERLGRLEAGTWSINATFVGFKRGCETARQEAIELVKNSALLVQ